MTKSVLASAVGLALLVLAGCSARDVQTAGPVAWLAGEEPRDVPAPHAQASATTRPEWPDGSKSDSNAVTRQPPNVFVCNSDRNER